MNFIISLLLNGAIVYLIAMFLQPNVRVNGFLDAVIVGVVLGFINYFIKPIVSTLALPITVITLGLFSLVINGLMVVAADYLLDGFAVSNFLWAIGFSVILSFANSATSMLR